MPKAETVVSAKEAAATLGVGRAMLNRYAATLESLTDEKIAISGRDGRQFSEEQVAVLVRAKSLVEQNHGLSVEAALKAALAMDSSGAEMTLAGQRQVPGSEDTGALIQALREALTAPLVEELKALRAEVAELRQDRQLQAPKEPAKQDVQKEKAEPGVLVRFATRLEAWIARLVQR